MTDQELDQGSRSQGRKSDDEGQGLWKLLQFWQTLPTPPTMGKEEKEEHRAAIQGAASDARKAAIEGLVRQYDEVNSDFSSIRSRAGGLLAATGVITGLVTLSTPFVAPLQSRSWLGFAGLLLTLAVLYCAVAAAWLAIRAQQVRFWGQAVVNPDDFTTSEKYGIEYCWSLYVMFKENQKRISVPVAYLRDAETFFRAVIVGLGLLVVLTLVGAIFTASTPATPTTTTHAATSGRHT
jgi:hypothetical protein